MDFMVHDALRGALRAAEQVVLQRLHCAGRFVEKQTSSLLQISAQQLSGAPKFAQ